MADYVKQRGDRNSNDLAASVRFLIQGSGLSAYVGSDPDLILAAKRAAKRLPRAELDE